MARTKKVVKETASTEASPVETVVPETKAPELKVVHTETRSPTKDAAIKELKAQRDILLAQNKTPGGKELAIYRVANTSLLRVRWKDGGEMPFELSGMWTSTKLAQEAIQAYLTKMWRIALGEESV